jgi:hypothetical protein
MKKSLILCLAIIAVAYGSQRVVIAEQFTGTWCTFCPGAARGLFEMYERTYDSLVVLAYHLQAAYDSFAIPEDSVRAAYYNVTGIPAVWFDGTLSEAGGQHFGNNYPRYRHDVTSRLSQPSPLEITLVNTYNATTDSGMISATILNTSADTTGGNLHFAIVEDDIQYNWHGMTVLEFVVRDMLPDAQGEAVTIPPSDTIIRSREYVTSPSWDESNCKIVVFVQSSAREIHQAAEIGLMEEPKMRYYGINVIETSGNGNGVIEPNEGFEIKALAKNLGDGTYTGPPVLECSDPYITITSTTPASILIGPGDVDTVMNFTGDVSVSCPDPHPVDFELIFNPGDTAIIPFIVTGRPGFSDDVESGAGEWTHYGTRDNWNITEHKSNSPIHSWYSGVEGSWYYTNENDASLASPYFVVPPGSTLYFYHQYGLENNRDFSYLDIDNGSGWWKTLDEFTGMQSTWSQNFYPLNDYDAQTVRIRFRFVSDYATAAEGWYVDDISVPTDIGVEEHISSSTDQIPQLMVYPNPFGRKTDIYYQITAGSNAGLEIYDATGRLVRQFNNTAMKQSNQVAWDGTAEKGHTLPAGVYFIRLNVDNQKLIKKAILLK